MKVQSYNNCSLCCVSLSPSVPKKAAGMKPHHKWINSVYNSMINKSFSILFLLFNTQFWPNSFICIHMYKHIHLYIHFYTYVYINIYTYLCIYIYTYINNIVIIGVLVNRCVYTQTYKSIQIMYIHTSILTLRDICFA